jgi:predicted ATPase/transcriptional regulator with XRE-family HTH domain
MRGEASFAQWLKRRRQALDLTQAELAQRVPCAAITLQKIEAGKRRPSKQMAERLAGPLGVPAEDRPLFVRFARAGGGARWSVLLSRAGVGPWWSSASACLTNLPAELTPLIGRQADVAAVRRQLLEDYHRLLTLVGAPGVGKSRLAIRVAAEALPDFGDGVYFVPLAPVSDPAAVAAAVARALGVNRAGDRPFAERLREYLRDRHLLLVLDNFEQVVEAAPLIADLLAACPWLSVLVTSRVPLRVRPERVVPVRPLALPVADDRDQGPAELLEYPAIALFVERARAANADLALTRDSARSIAVICARLDGLPLAIELVAARTRALPLEAILERLSGRALLQTGELRDVPERHRTLRDAIDWSYALLSPAEQALLARLGVFVGGWTLEAAQNVAGETDGVSSPGTREGLASLVDSSLVVRSEHGVEPRFTLLETIREYALDRLAERGEEGEIRRRHAEYCLALVEEADPHLRTAGQGAWLERLEAERGNLRAALAWAIEGPGQAELGLRLVGGFWWFWTVRGCLSEGRYWAGKALEKGEGAPPGCRARVLAGDGALAWQQGDLDGARALLRESIALYREPSVAPGWDFVLALTGYAMVASWQADQAAARAAAEEALAFSRRIDDKWCLALSFLPAAEAHMLSRDYAAARSCFQESLALFREVGDRWGMGIPLLDWGYLESIQGNTRLARALLEESVAMHRQVGERWQRALSLSILAQVVLEQGDPDRAAAFHEESLDLLTRMGLEANAAKVLCNLAFLAQSQGHAGLARRLFLECLALFSKLGMEEGVARCHAGLAAVGGAPGAAEAQG